MAAETHAKRIADRMKESARVEAGDAPPISPRSRLESFRAEQARMNPPAGGRPDSFRLQAGQASAEEGGGFQVQLPAGSSDTGTGMTIPGLGLASISSGALNTGGAPLSSRRLKKEVLKADSSTSLDSSNTAGHITLRDEMGTPRSARVVQQAEYENFNMVSIKVSTRKTVARGLRVKSHFTATNCFSMLYPS